MTDELLLQYEPLIYYHIHKMNLWRQFPSYREDMLQEGRMAVVKAYHEYNDRPNMNAYIHSSVRNAIYDYVFKEMKLNRYASNTTYLDIHASVDEDNSDMIFFTQFIMQHNHANLLSAYYLEGLTQTEVAKNLGVSQQWVSAVISKFRKELRNDYLDLN